MEFGGISFVTILPAAIKELSPIETPDNIIEPTPIQTFSPISISAPICSP